MSAKLVKVSGYKQKLDNQTVMTVGEYKTMDEKTEKRVIELMDKMEELGYLTNVPNPSFPEIVDFLFTERDKYAKALNMGFTVWCKPECLIFTHKFLGLRYSGNTLNEYIENKIKRLIGFSTPIPEVDLFPYTQLLTRVLDKYKNHRLNTIKELHDVISKLNDDLGVILRLGIYAQLGLILSSRLLDTDKLKNLIEET